MRPRPTFALSRDTSVADPENDLYALWQRDLDAGRLGTPVDNSAANEAADAWEAVVLGRPVRRP